jgi:hypothetical protein
VCARASGASSQGLGPVAVGKPTLDSVLASRLPDAATTMSSPRPLLVPQGPSPSGQRAPS